jgi:5'-nucleotidase
LFASFFVERHREEDDSNIYKFICTQATHRVSRLVLSFVTKVEMNSHYYCPRISIPSLHCCILAITIISMMMHQFYFNSRCITNLWNNRRRDVLFTLVGPKLHSVRSVMAFTPSLTMYPARRRNNQQRISIAGVAVDSTSSTLLRQQRKSSDMSSNNKNSNSTSYQVDEEQNVEGTLRLSTTTFSPPSATNDIDQHDTPVVHDLDMNGGAQTESRYATLLDEVGLQNLTFSKQHIAQTARTISPYDIFCNRELKLAGIRAVGFDMDYTLARYQQPVFDQLAFDGAKLKLVHNLGYPESVLDFQYDHTFWTRGLIIDTQRGNFLKIDRHKYVRVAYHGFDRMSSPTRKFLYSRTFNKVLSFSEKHFVNMDTLFQFVDAHLFASLVQLKDQGRHEELDMRTYEEMYRHVRESVDLCHRDGVIKDEVHRNPSSYIVYDKGLVPMLQRYRQQGMKLFLLTNSLWEYTSTAMNYLYHGERVSDEQQKKNEWLELFDLVIVGSCKPAYMLDPYLNLFRVRMEDGSLLNTDGLYEIDSLGENGATKFLQKGKTFQGGNWLHLQAMLEIEAGEEILYVGDHLYSDVLRSKRTLGWRSAFIMPELEEEMRVFAQVLPLNRQITSLRNLREELGIYADQIRQSNQHELPIENVQSTLTTIEEEEHLLKQKLQELTAEWHAAFHPIWGAMFNAGYQDSRFAFYVSNYACLYTSRATNLGLASTARSFRTTMEALPHDRLLNSAPQTKFVDKDPWENN